MKYFCRKNKMLKIGVIGAGHLGRIHISILKKLDCFDLVGFYDTEYEVVKRVSDEFKINSFNSAADLMAASEAICIVTPTDSHFDYAVAGLKNSKHLFIEKPLAFNLDEAQTLVKLASEASVKVQVGHVERFNPAFNASKTFINNPMFIEAHRLSPFNPRGTEVSVVLDLMIHDIDIALSTVKSNVKKVYASGVSVISSTPDIANARLEFDNGCVANLTASRISLNKMRKCRFFQKDAYVSIDFLNKTSDIIRLNESCDNISDSQNVIDLYRNGKDVKQILIEKPEIFPNNAIEEELLSFYKSIFENTSPIVSIQDGFNALSVAFSILDKLRAVSNHSS